MMMDIMIMRNLTCKIIQLIIQIQLLMMNIMHSILPFRKTFCNFLRDGGMSSHCNYRYHPCKLHWLFYRLDNDLTTLHCIYRLFFCPIYQVLIEQLGDDALGDVEGHPARRPSKPRSIERLRIEGKAAVGNAEEKVD